ncbi:MAG: PadR family transcriptional regulator [Phycisphaerales bacterium]
MASAGQDGLLQGTLDMLVLKTLAAGPNHGFGILERIERASKDVLSVEEGSLYPALHRLEKRGYIEGEWQRAENGRRVRSYRLTVNGRAKLKLDQATWTRVASAIDRVMGATARAIKPALAVPWPEER